MILGKQITIILFFFVIVICSLILFSVFKIDESFETTTTINPNVETQTNNFIISQIKYDNLDTELLEEIIKNNLEKIMTTADLKETKLIFSKYSLNSVEVVIENLDFVGYEGLLDGVQKENLIKNIVFDYNLKISTKPGNNFNEIQKKIIDFNKRKNVLKKVYNKLITCLNPDPSAKTECNSVDRNKQNLLNIKNPILNENKYVFIRKSVLAMKFNSREEKEDNIVSNIEDISFFIKFKNPNITSSVFIFKFIDLVSQKVLFYSYVKQKNLYIVYTKDNIEKIEKFNIELISQQKYFFNIKKISNFIKINFTGETMEEFSINFNDENNLFMIFGDITNTIKEISSLEFDFDIENYFNEELYTIDDTNSDKKFSSDIDSMFKEYKCDFSTQNFKNDINLGPLQNKELCYKKCMEKNEEKCNYNYCKYVCDNCNISNCIWNKDKINLEEQDLPYAPKITCFSGNESISVKWNKVENTLFPVTAYILTVVKMSGGKPDVDEQTQIITLSPNIFEYKVSNLKNQTFYKISMQSQNKNGLSEDCSNSEIIAPNGPMDTKDINYVLNPTDKELMRVHSKLESDSSYDCDDIFDRTKFYDNNLGKLFKSNILYDKKKTENLDLLDRIEDLYKNLSYETSSE